MRDLVIVGAGGHGREVLDVVEAINAERQTWRVLGFLDDGPIDPVLLDRRGTHVIGPVEMLGDLDAAYTVGIGDSATREQVAMIGDAAGRTAATLVHPQASVGGDVEIAPGNVLAAGARVTTNVRLGRHTHLNVNAVVSHDGRVGDFVTLSPGALVNGTVRLEDHVFLGTSAVVTPGRTVGSRTWIGAASLVLEDLPPNTVAAGVPARVLRAR